MLRVGRSIVGNINNNPVFHGGDWRQADFEDSRAVCLNAGFKMFYLSNNTFSMSKRYFVDQQYKGVNWGVETLEMGEYESCVFSGCQFSNVNLSEIVFADCSFEGCDFSLANINGTAFRTVQFKNCKLMGLRFDECNTFGLTLTFENSLLNLSSFFKLSLRKTRFRSCQLKEVDFTQSNLGGAVFEGCDLLGAVFDQTNLEQTDFRSAIHYSIDPNHNKLAKAKFSLPGVLGLLDRFPIVIE